MDFLLFGKLIGRISEPPLNCLLLGAVGIWLLKTRPRLGRALIITSWGVLYVLSTPIIVGSLRQFFEDIPPLQLTETSSDSVGAIVVLAGGMYPNAPEYGGDTVDGYELERLRYAARLYRFTGKPILAVGGSTYGDTRPESHAMKDALVNDFQVPVQWVEDQSRTTLENARFSAAILRDHNIHTVYLVTHASHMPRARIAFEQAGLQVVPAPTMFATPKKRPILTLLPSSGSLDSSANLIHEWIGRLWYILRDLSRQQTGDT